MNDDTRFVMTDEALAHSGGPEGWMSLGDLGNFLEPDAIHTLTAVSGLTGGSADERVMVVTGRFRTYREAAPVTRPVLIPADVWNRLPKIETLVDLIAPAGALLVRQAEEMLSADRDLT